MFDGVGVGVSVVVILSQWSTLVLNGKSPAAAKLAAHGMICEMCLGDGDGSERGRRGGG